MQGYRRLSIYRPELMGLAMLWVMLFHSYNLKFNFLPLDGFKAAGFAGVDVFILLSAMGLYLSIVKTQNFHLGVFYRRRFARILPTYWLVVGLYSLWLIARGRIGWSTAAWSLSALHYWFRIPGSFNWYVPAILAFYLLTPLYAALFRRCRHKIALTALMFPVSYGLYRLSIPLALNYTEDFICRIPAFALGFLMGQFLLTEQELTRRHTLVWTVLAVCGAVVEVLCLLEKTYISPCYRIALALVFLCLAATKLISLLPDGWIRKSLRMLGECSLEIYLINVIVTREFDTLAPYLDVDSRHIVFYLTVGAANIVLGILLHRLMTAVTRQRKAALERN